MKKLLLVLFIGLALSTSAFADHPGDLGIGVVFGGGFGNYSGYWYPGLSLKLGKIPIFWSIYVPVFSHSLGLSVTGDFYFFDRSLVAKQMTNEDGTYNFKLDWYLGIGASTGAYFGNGGSAHIGVRFPVGLSWHVIRQFEIALGIVPVFGVTIPPDFYWGLPLELTFRFWP